MNFPPEIAEGIIDAIACMDAMRNGDAEGADVIIRQGDAHLIAASAVHIANSVVTVAASMARTTPEQIIDVLRGKALEAREAEK